MTDIICPWCNQPVKHVAAGNYRCFCFGNKEPMVAYDTSLEINIYDNIITSFFLKLENSDLYCHFINKPGYSRWSIKSSGGSKIGGDNILFLQDGVIDLATAAQMLLRFTNLKAFI
jgi:hypothetical protein